MDPRGPKVGMALLANPVLLDLLEKKVKLVWLAFLVILDDVELKGHLVQPA